MLNFPDSEPTDVDGNGDSDDENYEEFAPRTESVILFIDVDSFEVQVRGRNMGFTSEQLWTNPFIVVNEYGVLTAVNYPAKTFGIKRKECNEKKSKKLCPNVEILRIPNHYGKPDSLKPRMASDQIYDSLIKSLKRQCQGRPLPVVEKASKDEFFIDLSEEVAFRINELEQPVPEQCIINKLRQIKCFVETPGRTVSGDTFSYRTLQVLKNKAIDTKRHESEAVLVHGAAIGHLTLKDIFVDTEFICSAGVSNNKLLAKIGCGRNKPDAITVLPIWSLPRVSKSIKISDIPGLAGKLGQVIQDEFKIKTMSQLQYIDRTQLIRFFKSENSLEIHYKSVGVDNSKVVSKWCGKTLTCGITFKSRKMDKDPENLIKHHLKNRFLEMREYLVYEMKKHGPDRIPKSLRLGIKTVDLRTAFGESIDLPEVLKHCISFESNHPECTDLSKVPNPVYWEEIYDAFLVKIKNNCQLKIFDCNSKVASEAILNVGAINLIANF